MARPSAFAYHGNDHVRAGNAECPYGLCRSSRCTARLPYHGAVHLAPQYRLPIRQVTAITVIYPCQADGAFSHPRKFTY
ncbi:conserved hypothetical protein [Ricinus communis]|uniref:Uncharacterized protein n=1 Tax=Ricinus communis TaxID=3988 RepID=B9TBW8_RICCO|nr:conserved hypothetical protein [Ricinus communis]